METYQNKEVPVERRLADLLSRMRPDEKVAQLCSISADILGLEAGRLAPPAQEALRAGIGLIGRPNLKRTPEEGARFTNAVQKYLVEKTRLGIPALFHEEALHGLMARDATSFPQAIGMASTWNPALVQRAYTAAAREMRTRGSTHALTPDLDLGREPRWGRTEETFGEDPYLVTQMALAAVGGLQGRGPEIAADKVLATAKHFAVHGQPEGGRNCAPANYSERVLRSQFFKPFEAAVRRAGVGSIMASYNEIDGIPAHVNAWLLQDVLRDEWGFDGLLISDGDGVNHLHLVHGVAQGPAEAARLALMAGIDLELADNGAFPTLLNAFETGQIPQQRLDEAVGRVLRAKFLLGLFDQPYVDVQKAAQVNNCAEHRQIALEAARQALVLLKNEGGLLPLETGRVRKMAVIGPNADGLHLGGYSYDPGRGVTIWDGLRTLAESLGIEAFYVEGCRFTDGPQDWRGWWEDGAGPVDPAENRARIAEAVELAQQVDVVVLVLGENESTCREAWSQEHLGDRDSLDLLGEQQALAQAVLATGTPVVALLINGRPLTINALAESVPAILECWYPGQEGGTAVAEALFGRTNPGGKLPITFPRSVGQLPAYYYHKPSAGRSYLQAKDGPLFPFGFGLSYTRFAYRNFNVTPQRISADGSAEVRVEVTNCGERAGDEVVQLYLRDLVSSVTRPVKELKAFRRLTLQPGETQTVRFPLTPGDLSFLNLEMQPVVEPGEFEIMVGGSSVEYQTVTLSVNRA